MKKTFTSLSVFFALALVFLPHVVEAKSVQWTTSSIGDLAYWFDFTLGGDTSLKNAGSSASDALFASAVGSESSTLSKSASWGHWSPGISNPSVAVTYSATVTNTDTGAPLAEGASIPTGTHLSFVFTPHAASDIYWFATGYSEDSPYGQWTSTLVPSLSVASHTFRVPQCLQGTFSKGNCTEPDLQTVQAYAAMPTCDANDYVGTGATSVGRIPLSIYVDLRVLPPSESISGAGNLSCASPQTDGSGNVTVNCTATKGGTYNTAFNFGATSGNFLYRVNTTGATSANRATYEQTKDVYWASICAGNNVPMRSATLVSGGGNVAVGSTASSAYVLHVPAQSIPFSFTVVSPVTPPAKPTLSCPSSIVEGQAGSFTVKGSEPSATKVRYGIDWSGSGTVNAWVPTSGYVAGGTQESFTHTWNTPGTYTVGAMTEDSDGNASAAWDTCSVSVVNDGSPHALLTASQSTIVAGGSSKLRWTCSNSSQASIDQSVGTVTPTAGGSVNVSPSQTLTYTLTCTGTQGGTATDTTKVTVENQASYCATHPLTASCLSFSYCSTHSSDPICSGGSFCETHPNNSSCSGSPGTNVSALLNADPSSIIRGFQTLLTWSSGNAVSCTGSGDGFDTKGKVAGSMSLTPPATTLYTVDCRDANGNHAFDTQTVTVTAPKLSITASPTLVRSGNTSVISWSVSGKVDSCTVSGPGLSSQATSGSMTEPIAAESTYTISCTAETYHPTASVTVKVVPSFREF